MLPHLHAQTLSNIQGDNDQDNDDFIDNVDFISGNDGNNTDGNNNGVMTMVITMTVSENDNGKTDDYNG